MNLTLSPVCGRSRSLLPRMLLYVSVGSTLLKTQENKRSKKHPSCPHQVIMHNRDPGSATKAACYSPHWPTLAARQSWAMGSFLFICGWASGWLLLRCTTSECLKIETEKRLVNIQNNETKLRNSMKIKG